MKNSRIILGMSVITLSAVYTSCSNSEGKKGVGIDVANFDSTVSASNDFYHFANGGWIKANPIPADQVRWGSFSILAENNRKNLHDLAEAASAKTGATKGSAEQLVGDFYFSAMDTTNIEKQGAAPIKGEMEAIDKLTDINSILAYVAKLQQWGTLYVGKRTVGMV